MTIRRYTCASGRNCTQRVILVVASALLLGFAPRTANAAIMPPSPAPSSALLQTQGPVLVAETETRHPRRYSKRAARRAWLKFKREAGPQGRDDLRQKAGQRKGWVQRLREAQRKKAERDGRAKASGEKTTSRNPQKPAPRRQQKLKRMHVID